MFSNSIFVFSAVDFIENIAFNLSLTILLHFLEKIENKEILRFIRKFSCPLIIQKFHVETFDSNICHIKTKRLYNPVPG